jgi:hypothetical protein
MTDAFEVMMDALDRTEEALAKPAKHTPGPWLYRPKPLDQHYIVDEKDMQAFAQVYPRYDGKDNDNAQAVATANAQLIAAAPDMAEALKAIAKHEPCKAQAFCRCVACDMSRLARIALEKAGV